MIRIAWRSLTAHKLRTFLTTLAILLGVAMIVGTYVLSDQIDRGFKNIFTEAYKGIDVTVTRKAKFTSQMSGSTEGLPQSLEQTLRGVDGVAEAYGNVTGTGAIAVRGKVVSTGGAPTLFFSAVPADISNTTYVKGGMPEQPGEVAEPAVGQRAAAAVHRQQARRRIAQPFQLHGDAHERADALLRRRRVHQHRPAVAVHHPVVMAERGVAGQAGAPGAVTDADEGIADIQNRPVLNTLTREIPARGYLNGIGADENSVLKTQGDLDSVFYHRQQIAKNGTPNVELHVDEGNNIIGANGRHRALAAIQQGGPDAKVNLTIFRHPDQTP